MVKYLEVFRYQNDFVGVYIIGCSRCISLCSVMGVGVGVEGECGYLWVFSDIKSIENCACKRKNQIFRWEFQGSTQWCSFEGREKWS